MRGDGARDGELEGAQSAGVEESQGFLSEARGSPSSMMPAQKILGATRPAGPCTPDSPTFSGFT